MNSVPKIMSPQSSAYMDTCRVTIQAVSYGLFFDKIFEEKKGEENPTR